MSREKYLENLCYLEKSHRKQICVNFKNLGMLRYNLNGYLKSRFNQLYHYMKENSLFTSDQSGFLRLHSTLTCLLKMSDDWYNGLDLSKLVGLVFIDLKKAFDIVEHDILCKKLELYGVLV